MRLDDFSALTFDCYGTLVDWETGLLHALRPWLAEVGQPFSDDQILEAFAKAESQAQAFSPGKRYPDILQAAMQTMGASWGIESSPAQRAAFAASVGRWPVFADTPSALRELKRHYRLAILSNVDRESFGLTHALLGVEFDHVFTAQDIGSYKPDPRNFEYALAKITEAGIGRGRVLHVAQSLFHDHVPAKKLGIPTVWIDRRAGKPGSGATMPAAVVPDWRFESLADFAVAVKRTWVSKA